MRCVPMRQIHLDFHTSPHIEGIGSDFDAAGFARTLKDANVEWINLFAKCHHGMFYYKTGLGTVHPHLETELLKKQIDACRSEGIKCGVYTCVGWSEDTADAHPEWLERSADGVVGVKKPFTSAYSSWQKLCLNNSEYRAYIKDELKEEYALFKPDSFWIDIIFQSGCVCKTCMAQMLEEGLDPQNPADVFRHDRSVQIGFMRDVHAHIKSFSDDVHIYFNCSPYEMDLADEAGLAARNKQDLCTYIDIESLPSDAWGYSHFPVAVNYVNKYEKELNMMNGKFHTSWGDFGSLRNKAALEYECFRALANGAGVCVGDQLHPSGRLDPQVYRRIGEVFASVREKEPWCAGTRKVSQIGVYATRRSGEPSKSNKSAGLAEEGVYRILTELKYTFDFLDYTDDISGYELVILPDRVYLDAAAARKLNAYIAGGGKALFTAESALEPGRGFLLEGAGVRYDSPAEYNPRYMRIDEEHFPGVPPMDYVTYEQGTDVTALAGTQVLSRIVNPYFNRGYYKFCSHRQTPPDVAAFAASEGAVGVRGAERAESAVRAEDANGAVVVGGADGAEGVVGVGGAEKAVGAKCAEGGARPAITRNGNVVYAANPLFTDYASNRCMVYRDIIERLIRDLGVTPIVEAALPSFVEATVRAKGDSMIVHLLNYIIERKCRRLDTIEETVPLYGRTLKVKTGRRPVRVTQVPAMKEIGFEYDGSSVIFTPDEIGGHEMYEINF